MNKELAQAIAAFLGDGAPPQQTAPQGSAPGAVSGSVRIPQNTASPNVTPTDVDTAFPDTHISQEQQPQDYGWLFQDPRNAYMQMLKNGQAPYSHFGENQVRGPRDKSANDRTAEDTLRYSRLVDRLNNRVYRMPGSTGTSGGGSYGRSSDRGPQIGALYQMPKVATAESRGQARNEEYETQKRGVEMARTEAYKNYDLMMQEMFMQSRNAMMLNGWSAELQRAQDTWKEKLFTWRYNNEDQYKRAYDAFVAQLGLDTKSAMFNQLVSIWKDPAGGAVFAQMFANMFGGGVVPNELNAISSRMAGDIWQKYSSGQYPNAAQALANYYTQAGDVVLQLIQQMAQSNLPELIEVGKMAGQIIQEQFGGGSATN